MNTPDEEHDQTMQEDLDRLSAGSPAEIITTNKHAPGYIMSQEEALALQEYIMAHALKIMTGKRRDYSGKEDPFRNLRSSIVHGVEPWRGTAVRIQDKFSRIRSIMDNDGKMEVEESLVDTFADIINYACIQAGLVWEELGLEVPNEPA